MLVFKILPPRAALGHLPLFTPGCEYAREGWVFKEVGSHEKKKKKALFLKTLPSAALDCFFFCP